MTELNEFLKYATAPGYEDGADVARMVSNGSVTPIPSGTAVKVVGMGGGGRRLKIQLLDGRFAGKTGWVADSYFR